MKREHINAKIMTVREFISEYLKRHIKEIKGNGYPFEAFMLMSIGIEFLGKCVNISFDKTEQSKKDFESAIDNLGDLNKYKNLDGLYGVLRCGLVHCYMLNDSSIELREGNNDLCSEQKVLGCDDFYGDFSKACDEILNSMDPNIKNILNKPQMTVNNQTTGNTDSNSSTQVSKSNHKDLRKAFLR